MKGTTLRLVEDGTYLDGENVLHAYDFRPEQPQGNVERVLRCFKKAIALVNVPVNECRCYVNHSSPCGSVPICICTFFFGLKDE